MKQGAVGRTLVLLSTWLYSMSEAIKELSAGTAFCSASSRISSFSAFLLFLFPFCTTKAFSHKSTCSFYYILFRFLSSQVPIYFLHTDLLLPSYISAVQHHKNRHAAWRLIPHFQNPYSLHLGNYIIFWKSLGSTCLPYIQHSHDGNNASAAWCVFNWWNHSHSCMFHMWFIISHGVSCLTLSSARYQLRLTSIPSRFLSLCFMVTCFLLTRQYRAAGYLKTRQIPYLLFPLIGIISFSPSQL